MLIQFQRQEGAVPHDFVRIGEQERVRTTVEVRQVDRRQVRIPGDMLQGGNDSLPIVPVGLAIAFTQERQIGTETIERDDGVAGLGELLRQVEVDTGIIEVVRTSDQDQQSLTVPPRFGDGLSTLVTAGRHKAPLRFQRLLPSPANGGAIAGQGTRQRLDQIIQLPGCRQV